MGTSQPVVARPRRAVGLLAVTQFLLEVQFWFPLWLIFLLHLGFDLTTAVLADGVFRLVSVLAEIPMGLLADRMGRKASYLLITGLSAVTFAGIAMINSTWQLFGMWIVWGVLWALNSGAATTYAYELSQQLGPKQGPRGFSVIKGAGQAAVLVSLVTAGLLYGVDPALPFWVTAAMAVVAGLLALGLPDVPRVGPPATLGQVLADIRAALAARVTRSVMAVAALFMFYGWSVRILFQPLALDLELTPEQTGWMYAGVAAVGIVASLATGWVRPTHRRLVIGGGMIITVVAAGLTFWWPWLGPVAWLPMLSLAWAAGWTTLELELSGRTRPSIRATVLSLVASVAGIGIAVARPGLGALADRTSSPVAYGVWAAVGVIVMVVFVILLRRMGDHPMPAVSADRDAGISGQSAG
ncbi:MFS transporter [Microlunatus sp. Y2014]|uniref:MFS transporter n=1 Tax=Microlunatus sp. Y2014 TaxID=3418488 RepID=UPI003DA754FF